MATYSAVDTRTGKYTLTLTVTEDSYSIANNSSVVSYSLSLKGVDGYYYQQYGTTYIVNVNGEQVNTYQQLSMPSPSQGVSTLSICSGTVTVPHNNDGAKSITCSASLTTATSQSYLPGSIVIGDHTLALTNIPRTSSMTVPSMTVGSSATFNVSAASSSFTHTITYTFGSLSGTAATLSAGATSATWTPPTTFYAQMPNSTSKTVSLILHTFSGATEIGSVSYSGTVSVGSAIKPTAPTVTLTPVNTNAWINSHNLYVGGYSKVKVQSSATAGSGASMSSYTISGAFSGTGSNVTSDVLTAGNKTIKVTATDSRGRTNSTTNTVTFLSYSNPAITTFKATRGTYSGGSWTSNTSGSHIRIQAVGSVSLSNEGNTGTITVKTGNTNPSATSGNYYYFTSTNATTSYTFTGTITDSVGNTVTKKLTVSTITVPLNIDVDLPSVGVGMIAQNANQLDINTSWAVSPYKLKGSQYYTGGYFGIDMNNSDIVGANSFYFRDVTDGYSEGIHFIDSNGKYDTIWADGGAAYIRPSHTIGTADTTEKRLLTVDDLYYKAGDTFSCRYIILSGFVTSGTAGLRFNVVVPKLLDNITSVTITSMTGSMRGPNGYIDSDSSNRDWTSIATASAYIRSSNIVGLEIDGSSAWGNVTNNTPVVFYANTSFVLTFA